MKIPELPQVEFDTFPTNEVSFRVISNKKWNAFEAFVCCCRARKCAFSHSLNIQCQIYLKRLKMEENYHYFVQRRPTLQ